MDAQCWLWGQDIRYPDGNLLLAYGLERCQWENGGHATYYRGGDGTLTAVLWSGGMLLSDAKSTVQISRHGLDPRLSVGQGGPADPRAAGQGTEAVPLALDDPRAARAFRWMCDYEAWVEREANGWRAGCALRWDDAEREAQRLAAEVDVEYEPLPPIPPAGLASRWAILARAAPGDRTSVSVQR